MPWALVTGAARRLGRETALHLARQGWDLHLHYHTSGEEARDLAEKVQALGREARIHRADLSQETGVRDLVASLGAEESGKAPRSPTWPTLLVNSASGWGEGTWDSLEAADFHREFQTSSLSPFFLAREMIRRSPRGLVVNLLDARMEDYDKNHLAYHLAKRGLASLTRVLALEAAPGWRINAVAPGLLLKPEGMPDPTWEDLAGTNPLGLTGTPEDFLRTLDYYLDSPLVTGQVIFLDGGRFLKGGFYGF